MRSKPQFARKVKRPILITMAVLLTVSIAATAANAATPFHPPRPDLQKLGNTAPCGVATDSAGNYYVVDSSNSGSTPRKVIIYSPSGQEIVSFSTTPLLTGLSLPGLCKLAVDSAGRIYAVNTGRNRVVRLKPEGAGFPPTPATTYVRDASLNGNGILIEGNAGAASAVAVDPSTQDAYVSSIAGNEIQDFTRPSESYALRFNGEETTTPALEASSTCEDVQGALQDKFGAGNITATAGFPSTRCKITFAGVYENTDVDAVEVIKAGGNESANEVFKGSASPHVSSFTSAGAPISNTIGSTVAGAEFIGVDVYGKNGSIYVADKAHGKALVLNHAGDNVLAEFDGADSPTGAFNWGEAAALPAVAVDQSNGHVYISDLQAHHVVDEFDAAGNFVSALSQEPFFEEEFPGNGIAVDNGASSPNKGTIFFTARTASGANRGVFAFGPSSPPFHPPRPDLQKLGNTAPCGVATDSAGNYYVVDSSNSGSTPRKVIIYSPSGQEIVSFSTTPLLTGLSLPGLCKLAVDSAGRIYAVNTGRNRVVRLKPEGAGFPPTPATTYVRDASLNGNGILIEGNAGAASAVAVDPSTQDAYVSSIAGNEIQDFTRPSESYALRFNGEETTTPALEASSTCEDVQGALQDKFGAGNITATAGFPSTRCKITFAGVYENTDVDAVEVIKAGGNESANEVFKGSASPHVSSFTSAGAPISNTIGSTVAGAEFIGVDVYGKNGSIYVADKAHGKALVLNHAGDNVLAEFDGADSPTGAFNWGEAAALPAVAVDQSNGHVYISDLQAHHVVDEFDAAGNFVSALSQEPFFEEEFPGNGIAVDNGASSPNKGTIFFTARTASGANRGVFAFGPSVYGFPLKVSKTGQGSGVVTSEPVGINCGAACDAEFEANTTVALSVEPGFGSRLGEWSGCNAINVDDECEVTMSGAHDISVRLDSQPLVTEESAGAITDTTVELSSKVNPKGLATSYYFEYLTAEAAEENDDRSEPAFTGATKVPPSPVAIGDGITAILVAAKVQGLKPSTAYRFRAVASNDVGTVEGELDSGHEEIAHSFTTYSPPQIFTGECPGNEALRTGLSARLPDCRAYEQASPVDKNGGSLQATAPFTRTAEDGSTITFESTTGVPGGAGSQNFPTYMAKRGATGWATTGLLPNPSSGQRARVLGWTPSFDTVFDFAELFGGGATMLSRSTASGGQTEIVPHTSPSPTFSYVDTSANGVTVFEAGPAEPGVPVQLTANAAAGKPNVYAWTQGPPSRLNLVGVLPNGTTPTGGSRAAGGSDASEYYRDGHLVGSGDSVVFNDNTDGQLYLRLNPMAAETTEKDSEGNCVPDEELACTVHISASHKTDGNGSGGTDPVGPQPAFFKAASRDGSVVTFTSSEKLTNDANTGPEPEAPVIARAKASDGSEKNLSFIPAFANEIAVDGAEGYVYWSDPAHSRIGRAKLDGTGIEEEYKSISGKPLGIAVVDTGSSKYIYWSDQGELDENNEPQSGLGTIGRMDLDGSNVNPSCFTGLTNPRSIASNGTDIYWTEPVASSVVGNGGVGKATLACEGVEGGAKGIAVKAHGNGDIAVDAIYIYISEYDPSAQQSFITRHPIDSGVTDCVGPVFEDETSPVGIAISSEKLYWVDPRAEKVGRADLNCVNTEFEKVEADFIAGASRAEDPAIAGEYVLWTANQGIPANPGNDLYQFRLSGTSGTLEDLAPDSSGVDGTDVVGVLGSSDDGSYVYFAANGVPDGIGNSPNANGESAAPGNCKGIGSDATGSCNLLVAHDGQIDFIARLNAHAPSAERIEPDEGDWANWHTGRQGLFFSWSDKAARVSTDGKALVFRSSRRLTAYDNEGLGCLHEEGHAVVGQCLEFYRFDFENMDLACLTCNPRDGSPSAPATLASVRSPNIDAPDAAATLGRNLSRSGDRFFFETDEALVAEDTNGRGGCVHWGSPLQAGNTCQDVYEWEASGTGSCKESSPAYSSLNQGCIYLISGATSEGPAFFGDADPQGNNVFIFTYAKLVPQDTDALFDAYDVRVGGGLVSQHEVTAPPCVGEVCRPEPGAPPLVQSPGSSGVAGPSDPKPKRVHHKKKHKKHKKHKRKHGAKTKKSRGAGR